MARTRAGTASAHDPSEAQGAPSSQGPYPLPLGRAVSGAQLSEQRAGASAVLFRCRASADTPPQAAHAVLHGRRSRAEH